MKFLGGIGHATKEVFLHLLTLRETVLLYYCLGVSNKWQQLQWWARFQYCARV